MSGQLFRPGLRLLWRPVPRGQRRLPAVADQVGKVSQARHISSSPARCRHDEFTQRREERREREQLEREREAQEEDVRGKILDASLAHVPALSWTREALSAGARDAGFPAVTSGIIEDAGFGLLQFHTERSNARLNSLMSSEATSASASGERLRVRPFLRRMVEARLRMNAPFLSRWPDALALQAHPLNAAAAAELDLRMFDDIWHWAGDKSPDCNWYTKRLSLGAIYKATELAMMQDVSQDYKETWAFLDRRFEDEVSLAGMVAGSKDAGNVAEAVFETLRNMAGVARR